MDFAQALARIEMLKSQGIANEFQYEELTELLVDHADSIVQLGKVAGDFREAFDGDSSAWSLNEILAGDAMDTYDKLMKGE